MVYFFVLLIALLFINVLGGSKIVRNYVCIERIHIAPFLALLILIGFRDISVGTDTPTYVAEFLSSNQKGLVIREIFQSHAEPLFALMRMLIRQFTDSYTVYFLVAAIPISLGFAIYVGRYSDDYMMSTLLFILLGVLGFCMAGLRQSIAIGFSLFGYRYAREKKLIPFLICCTLAFGFHNSSLVFLIVYPLSHFRKININIKWWIAIAAAFVLGITKNSVIMQIASMFFTQERYNMYGTTYTSNLNYTMLLIQIGLLVFCYMYRELVMEEDEKNSLLYIMAFIGTSFQCFTPILGEFFRLSLFFSISFCILVPKTIYLLKDSRNRNLLYFVVNGVCLYYIFFAGSSIAHTYLPVWRSGM